MKKKLGFLLSSCMSVSALPLFAAACKNEQANGGKQEEIDVNTLFKISLPKNNEKKPSELKPKDIIVEILNNDINVEIKKVEFKEGKGVLVSYLATNSKTNKIVDEKTITLEIATKKDQEPKQDKKYDDLVTVIVDDKTKQKSADEVTKENIKISIKEGETFNATVESVNVLKKQLDSVNVKIKIVDGDVTKHIYKKIEGFVKAYPKEVKDGYTKFKDLKIVDDSKAHEWLNKSADKTVIYYDRDSGKFFVSKPKKDNNNDNLAIFQVKSKPKNTIETAAPKGSIKDNVNEESYKATALLIKEGEKVGIKFRISLYDHKTKKPIFYEKIETSNLLEIDKEKISKPITSETGKSDMQGDQPPVENNGSLEKDKDTTKDESAQTDKKENPDKKVDSGTNEAPKEKENPVTPGTSSTNSETNKKTDDKNKPEAKPSENQDAPKTETEKKETPNSTTTETINKENTTPPNSNTLDNNSDQPLNNKKPKEEAPTDPKASESSSNTDQPISKPINKNDGIENGVDHKDSNKNDEAKNLRLAELYEPSKNASLLVLKPSSDKENIKKQLDEAIEKYESSIRIDGGIIKNADSKKTKISGLEISDKIDENVKRQINTHGGEFTIGQQFMNKKGKKSNRKGIKVEKKDDNKYQFSWYLITKDGKPTDTIFTQELDLS
ncbi:Hypothetical protein, predicted lipoprotein [Mycoplasmopsis bovigenitalium 51080]|uniref:Lipoprotein n=1 Tax=Mycoplasmopsis bovigenitalium 51080 TaxID=1188235 RepID=N9V310_9BACT|nr:hypothetical protein [Mycoplasmopsis bovigenitalium]ENY69722.1 Hypothetical protein, predicted lipoprotein [Mycoplasmopsis bovigenitalium 51080]